MNYTYKKDQGKPQISLVPPEAIEAIAKVRTWAVSTKYPEAQGWKNVEPDRLLDAALRHLLAYMTDSDAVDAESGLPAIYHALSDIAFLAALSDVKKADSGVKQNTDNNSATPSSNTPNSALAKQNANSNIKVIRIHNAKPSTHKCENGLCSLSGLPGICEDENLCRSDNSDGDIETFEEYLNRIFDRYNF